MSRQPQPRAQQHPRICARPVETSISPLAKCTPHSRRLLPGAWPVLWVLLTLFPYSSDRQLGVGAITMVTPAPQKCTMTFHPAERLSIQEGEEGGLLLNVTCDVTGPAPTPPPALRVRIEDPYLLALRDQVLLNLTTDGEMLNLTFIGLRFGTVFVTFEAVWMTGAAGVNRRGLNVMLLSGDEGARGALHAPTTPTSTSIASAASTRSSVLARYEVAVMLPPSNWTLIFQVVLGIMIVIYNFGFGCKVQVALILQIIKRPVAPAIGLCCQFLVMAPLSFGIARLLRLPPVFGLGLLSIGAAPGGGGSNVFAYLLDGDLELSITMSFISTLASLAMTPMWIWALGRFFNQRDDNRPPIPVVSVFSSLAVVTLPVIIGVLVNRFQPRAAKRIAWCLKPATGVIGAVFMSLGVYVYHYALLRVQWRTFVACLLVPLAGYLIGGAAGKIFRQTKKQCITISLETGFQNLALSLMILNMALEPPDSNLAGVVPICYTFMSATFPVVAFLIKMVIRLHKHRLKSHGSHISDSASSPEGVVSMSNTCDVIYPPRDSLSVVGRFDMLPNGALENGRVCDPQKLQYSTHL